MFSSPTLMLLAAEEHRVEIVSPPLPPSFSSSTVFGVVLPSPCHPTHPPHQDLDMVTVSACLPYICVCPMSMSVSYSGISLLNANSSVGSWLLMCKWPTLQWFGIHVLGWFLFRKFYFFNFYMVSSCSILFTDFRTVFVFALRPFLPLSVLLVSDI